MCAGSYCILEIIKLNLYRGHLASGDHLLMRKTKLEGQYTSGILF
jgi:hypothetical protein